MALEFLKRWFAGRPEPRPDLRFLLYTRAECPLCEEAWEMLVRYQKSHGFVLEVRNVDESAELCTEFGTCVPVLAINGKVRFRGRINEVLLLRILSTGKAQE